MARHAAVWRGSFWCRGGTIRSESPPKVRRLRPGCRAAAGTGASLCVDPLAKHVVKDSAVPVVLHFQLGIETADQRHGFRPAAGADERHFHRTAGVDSAWHVTNIESPGRKNRP